MVSWPPPAVCGRAPPRCSPHTLFIRDVSNPPCPQWLLDCLACLLKLICQFAVDPADLDLAYHDVFAWSGLADGQRKRAWPGKSRKAAGDHGKGLHIPRLTEVP